MLKGKSINSKKVCKTLAAPLTLSLLLAGGLNYSKTVDAAVTNLAAGKTFTSSSTISSGSFMTDGDKNSNNYAGVTESLQWVQVDLGKSYDINKINLWHYFSDGRTYHDVIIRTSNDPNFSSGVTTIFNNDKDNSAGLGAGSSAEYAETSAGKNISFNTTNARYVRFYSNGSTANIYNHYVEIEIYNSDTSTTTPTNPTTGKVMFDDFNYSNSNDANLGTHGWTLRNEVSGPGPSGCKYSPSNISFLNDSQNASNKIMRLTATTNGTGSGTSQAEIYTTSRKYLNGTYAARVRFTDTPTSGTDGAAINETFFTISPLESYRDPNYSELDFEYLANGGWGSSTGMWTTAWHTYTEDPWYKDGDSVFKAGSYAGWHTLAVVVANGYNTYYIDGVQFAKDGPANGVGNYYLPRKNMNIDFNLWFITGEGEPNLVNSTYVQDVDWVYHSKDTALTPAQIDTAVQSYRSQGVNFVDNVN